MTETGRPQGAEVRKRVAEIVRTSRYGAPITDPEHANWSFAVADRILRVLSGEAGGEGAEGSVSQAEGERDANGLLPCPFCGEPGELRTERAGWDCVDTYVRCTGCFASTDRYEGAYGEPAAGRSMWNQRALPPNSPAPEAPGDTPSAEAVLDAHESNPVSTTGRGSHSAGGAPEATGEPGVLGWVVVRRWVRHDGLAVNELCSWSIYSREGAEGVAEDLRKRMQKHNREHPQAVFDVAYRVEPIGAPAPTGTPAPHPCTSSMDGCACIHERGHAGPHHDGLAFWGDEDADANDIGAAPGPRGGGG